MHVLEEWLDAVIFSRPWDRVDYCLKSREHPVRSGPVRSGPGRN
jgi:hypothetical protein